jgi:hypothetical protein
METTRHTQDAEAADNVASTEEHMAGEGRRWRKAKSPPTAWAIGKPVSQSVQAHLDTNGRNATYNRRMAHAIESAVLVASASIPVATTLGAPGAVVGGLGGVVTVLAGMATQFPWRENWTRHSQLVNVIHREAALYDAGVPPYGDDTAYAALAMNVENLVLADAAVWSERERRAAITGSLSTPTSRP